MKKIQLTGTIPEQFSGKRLDLALSLLFQTYSRARLKDWILKGYCRVNHGLWRPKDKVKGKEQIEIQATLESILDNKPELMPLAIVYQDAELIVLNKPSNLVVHPGNGRPEGTLLNGLLAAFPELHSLPRAGIVHRLDKNTTGLMMVARTLNAHKNLIEQLQKRTVKREYLALVQGQIPAGGTIDQPIGRHPKDRTRMCVSQKGKRAVTHYRVLEKYDKLTYLKIALETGRTHQIRVHMAFIHHPLVGDKRYANRGLRLPKGLTHSCIEALENFPRQALHATSLGLVHPSTQQPLLFHAPLPEDFSALLETLKTIF